MIASLGGEHSCGGFLPEAAAGRTVAGPHLDTGGNLFEQPHSDRRLRQSQRFGECVRNFRIDRHQHEGSTDVARSWWLVVRIRHRSDEPPARATSYELRGFNLRI